ncbi:hypothetical protein Lal_00043252 [Lupinus albus]|nr:hypothetical protein Lal_00043252 [Lupinus albus]
MLNEMDIKVTTHKLLYTMIFMQYTILFPHGTNEWDTNTTSHNGRRITCREYYSYMLHIPFINNINFLLQQTLTNKKYYRHPSSVVVRDLTRLYAINPNDGKLDIFLTLTCNPSWCEITSELKEFQTTKDRFNLTIIIFWSKFEQLRIKIIDKSALRNVKNYMYITE